MFSAGETVTVIRPAARNRVGDRTGEPVEHTIDNCGINQSSTSEVTDRRETTVTGVELMCPPRADIRAGDKVRLPSGSVYEVDGEPWTPHNPFTAWEPGCIVRLRGVKDAA